MYLLVNVGTDFFFEFLSEIAKAVYVNPLNRAVNSNVYVFVYAMFTQCLRMSDVIAVRVPKKLKEELQELDLDYAEEMRMCLERLVKRKKLKKALKEVDKFRDNLSKKTGMTTPSAEIIRENREHAH